MTLLIIFLLTFIPTLAIWIPFFLRLPEFWSIPLPQQGLATIVANYDGPLYLVVAKTFYNLSQISQDFAFPLPTEYYAAHFPLFPLLIRLTAEGARLLDGNSLYPYAMLAVTLVFSFATLYFFNKFIGQYLNQKNALWLTFIFSLFPARWLITRSVGSPEPLFMAAIIASIFYFQNKKYWLAGIWGAIAQATKSPGILLFLAYAISLVIPALKTLITTSNLKKVLANLNWKGYPIVLIPLSLLAVFAFYSLKFDNFWAYFNSGDNIHLFFPPFQIFNYSASWVGTFWLEEVIFIYLLGAIGTLMLFKQKKGVVAWFTAIFFASTLFVSHRDLMRYSLPIVPFILAAFADSLTKKEFRLAFLLIIIPIYLFALAFISQNAMPIADWSPFI